MTDRWSTDAVDFRHLLPLGSENTWTDLLATLVESDPGPICSVMRLDADPNEIVVTREESVDSRNRPDLILRVDERIVAVVEVKLLSGLGPQQLSRYEEAVSDSERFFALFLERLAIDARHASRWEPLTWEKVLDAYCGSASPWVAGTAAAWLRHLERSVPAVDQSTVWNAIPAGDKFVTALRARMTWVYSNFVPPASLEHDLVGSTAGVSWVNRVFTPIGPDGYQIAAEIEENLPVRLFPKLYGVGKFGDQVPLGPAGRVVLRQNGVSTSAGFDWDRLLRMWGVMEASRDDWVRNAARPRGIDRENHLAMQAKGGPPYLGVGFGDSQARSGGWCQFGARLQFPPDLTLQEVLQKFAELGELVEELAAQA